MSKVRVLIGVTLGALALSGCSLVPTTSALVSIQHNKVPFGLLHKTIPGTNHARVRFITQPVYIVDATGHLALLSRIVPSPPVLASVLRELILGPTAIETSAGYSMALPKNLVVLQATVKNNIGFIDLAVSLSTLPHAQQILAIGQLVLTSYEVGATRGIEISVAGVAQKSALPNGSTSLLVTDKDYSSLLNG